MIALALSLLLAAPPAPPKAAPAAQKAPITRFALDGAPPRAPATAKPVTLLAQRRADGGWTLTVPGNPERATLKVAHAPMTGRTLIAWSAQSEDSSRLLASEAALVGPDGKTLRAITLPGLLPIEASLSPDGTIAAIIVSSFENPNADYQLLVFDEKGNKRAKRKTEPEQALLVTRSWIALWSPTYLPGSAEEEEEGAPPPAQTAEPASFLSIEGSPKRSGEPIGGNLATLGPDGLVSVAGGRLSTHKPTFARRGRLDLGFAVGVPFVSADGSTIAVGDFTDDDRANKEARTLVMFDADAKKIGSTSVMAALGVDAAVAFDGATVLATPATTGIGGPSVGIDPKTSVELVMFDRTGKQRWKHAFNRRSRTEHVRYLTVAAGGARSAFLRSTEDEDDEPATPSSVTILGVDGSVMAETDLEATGLWLDKAGAFLSVAGQASFSRLSVKSLAAPAPEPAP